MTKTWVELAACRDHDPALFFPLDEDGPAGNAAKAICGTCPVRAQCLSHALDAGECGIWGGTSESERRAIRRGRTAAKTTPPGPPARVA